MWYPLLFTFARTIRVIIGDDFGNQLLPGSDLNFLTCVFLQFRVAVIDLTAWKQSMFKAAHCLHNIPRHSINQNDVKIFAAFMEYMEPVLFPIACANLCRNSCFFPSTIACWDMLNKQAFWSQKGSASHRQSLLGGGSPIHKGHLSTNHGVRQSNNKHKPACYTSPTHSMIKSPTDVLMSMPHR